MKRTLKLSLLVAFALSLLFSFALISYADENEALEKEVIIVGETLDSEGNVYTLDSAWAYQTASASEVEVVVKTNNANLVTDLTSVNKSGKITTLQLTEDVILSSGITIATKAHITIDVSGFTFASGAQIALYNVDSILTFRTTTAAGKVVGNNSDKGFVRLDMCRNNTSHCTVEFIGANNTDKALTYEGVELIQMESDGRGYQKVYMNNFIYNASKSLFHGRKSLTSANPVYVQIDAVDSIFYLTPGEGFLWHDTAQNGLISLGSYLHATNCQFISKTTGKTTQFFYYNGGNMVGKWYMEVIFDDCDFTEIGLNLDSIYSYSKAVTDAEGSTTYEHNYPEGVAPANYYETVASAGWDATKQVTFVGHNTFTKCTGLNSTNNGFTAVNATANNKVNQYFYDSSAAKLCLFSDEFDNATDLLSIIGLANANTSKKAVMKLTEDITLPEGASGRTNIIGNLEIDLAGHTLTLGTVQNWTRGTLLVYSSEKGGVLLSHSSNTMFQLDVKGKPHLTFGKEEYPKENLTVKSTAAGGQGGIAVFCSDFEGVSADIHFYNCQIESARYLIKLNSKANSSTYPEFHSTFKGCDVALSYCGILTYNENAPLSYPTQSGLFKEGSYVNVEGCNIYAKSGSSLFYTTVNLQTEESTSPVSNFNGRFYGKVTFKNTAFTNVTLNQNILTSTKENLAQNSLNANYTVSDDWDVSEQVTFMEGCTFRMGDKIGIEANGNAFMGDNTTVLDGYVLARTEHVDAFAILPEAECVEIVWQMPEETFSVYYKNGVNVYVPALPESVSVNGNTYVPKFDKTPQDVATENCTYTLKWSGGARLSGNYTLEVAIDFFAYVPVSNEITHINGISVLDMEQIWNNDIAYYKVRFENLAPKDAYKSQCVSLTVALPEQTVIVDRYVSIVGYAKAALASDLDPELKSLVLFTLDYINKTNVFFGGASVKQIETLLSDNNFTPYEWIASNVKELDEYENVKFACLDLNQTPGFVFVVDKDYAGTVVVNGKAYEDYVSVTIEGVQYKCVIVEIPAHNLAEDLNVVCGNDQFVFNLDTYIASEASTEPYAHALYGYVVAAMAYSQKQ